MTRRSVEVAQQVITEMLNEQRADKSVLGKLFDHSVKQKRKLEEMMEQALAEAHDDFQTRVDDIKNLFEHLITEEGVRQQVLEQQMNQLSGDNVTALIGHNSKHAKAGE